MRGSYEELSCPFCDKGRIKCNYVLGVWSQRRAVTGSLPGKRSVIKSKDVWEIKSGCSECDKTIEEVKKALKKGIPQDKEKFKKRYEEIMKLREEMKKEKV